MNIFALLRLFGHNFISHEIKNTLDHHMSEAGRAQFAANLSAAGNALTATPVDTQTAADALANVVLAIH